MKRLLFLSYLVGRMAIAPLHAATVIAVTGDTGSSGGGLSLANQYGSDSYSSLLAVGWSATLGYTNVTISAQIQSNNPVGSTGQAFLTTSIGPGTTVAQEVAETSFVFPSFTGTWSDSQNLTLFTGLTLAAGVHYYLTIAPDPGITAGWNYGGALSSDDPGTANLGLYAVSNDGRPGNGKDPAAYIPASAFAIDSTAQPDYSVTGTAVPEPSSLTFLGIGLALFARRPKRNGGGT